jgi:hypothetical protein
MYISPHHRGKPYAAFIAADHIAYHGGVVCQKHIFSENGRFSFNGKQVCHKF